MSVVPPALESVFRRAGWTEARSVPLGHEVPMDHPAFDILAELAGIKVVHPRSWRDRRRGWQLDLVEFMPVAEMAREVARWEDALNSRIIGIGEIHNAHGELYITDRGQLIGTSIIHPAFWFEGRTFAEGISSVVNQQRSRPMLLPDQDEVVLYGEVFGQGSPEVIGPTAPEWR